MTPEERADHEQERGRLLNEIYGLRANLSAIHRDANHAKDWQRKAQVTIEKRNQQIKLDREYIENKKAEMKRLQEENAELLQTNKAAAKHIGSLLVANHLDCSHTISADGLPEIYKHSDRCIAENVDWKQRAEVAERALRRALFDTCNGKTAFTYLKEATAELAKEQS